MNYSSMRGGRSRSRQLVAAPRRGRPGCRSCGFSGGSQPMKSGVQCVLEVRFHGVAVALCRVNAVQGGAVCAIGWSSCEEACHRDQRCPWDAVAQAHISQTLGSSHSRSRGWRRKGVAHRRGYSVHVVGKRWLVAVGLILRGDRAGMASSWTETRAFRGVTVHNLYRRPAAHPSRHTSPARARPRRPGWITGCRNTPHQGCDHTRSRTP